MRHQPGPRRFPAHRPLLLLLFLGLLLYVLLPAGPAGLAGQSVPDTAVVPAGASVSLPDADADAGADADVDTGDGDTGGRDTDGRVTDDLDTDSGARSWPLAGRPALLRGWEPPAGPYGPGHRGVDLAAEPGARVLAAADGRVSFAGRVAGRGVLAIEVAGSGSPPLRTTYEPVRSLVEKGANVRAGQPVAVLEAGPFHCAAGCLHWGLRRGDAYLDPLSLLPPGLLRRGPSRLLPVFGVPEPGPPSPSGVRGAGSGAEPHPPPSSSGVRKTGSGAEPHPPPSPSGA
ncbi:murein hydrolase activator EnvC [Streptomyces sp. PTY087I2]|uniref:murein hydrolase activator EnvC family protein n=1 Tax=Streptomyces sp. PTY087I2 TaxID=1819298 RepID=UPI00080BAE89|nr:M23 family metallopeptidase [Streptomyces sp. PTY087I2]OCC13093.1 AmiB activator [Streptomyces sp. PTY087I2]